MKSARSAGGKPVSKLCSRQGGRVLSISKSSWLGDFDERILVGRMQPAAAEVEGDARARP